MMKSAVYANYAPHPKEIRESPCLIFTKWLQCDQYKHWVHLVYSTEKRVIRKRDVFLCPYCKWLVLKSCYLYWYLIKWLTSSLFKKKNNLNFNTNHLQ
jgi:hypothetical protein